jgi:hypothetical protein
MLFLFPSFSSRKISRILLLHSNHKNLLLSFTDLTAFPNVRICIMLKDNVSMLTLSKSEVEVM